MALTNYQIEEKVEKLVKELEVVEDNVLEHACVHFSFSDPL